MPSRDLTIRFGADARKLQRAIIEAQLAMVAIRIQAIEWERDRLQADLDQLNASLDAEQT